MGRCGVRVAGCLVLFALFLVCGCSPRARHEVLTFFFTGVPPLEEAPALTGHDGTRAGQPLAETAQVDGAAARPDAAGAKAKETLPVQRQLYYSHPVWLEGDCAVCHETRNLFAFKQDKKKESVQTNKVFWGGGGMPGPLKADRDKLCSGCHSDLTGLRALRDRLWLHNPVAKGQCLACHDPHQSRFKAVVRQPVDQLCHTCHDLSKALISQTHAAFRGPCLSCHNPHMGKDRLLLRADHQEVRQLPVRSRP